MMIYPGEKGRKVFIFDHLRQITSWKDFLKVLKSQSVTAGPSKKIGHKTHSSSPTVAERNRVF